MPDVYCFKLTEDKKAYVCKSLKCRKRSKTRPSKGDSQCVPIAHQTPFPKADSSHSQQAPEKALSTCPLSLPRL